VNDSSQIRTSAPQPAAPANQPVWDDGVWESLPALSGEEVCDTVVVGLGGSGLTAIGELLDSGENVIGIDAIDVGAGAAGRNGGFLLAGAYDFYHDAVRLFGAHAARRIYDATRHEIDAIDAAVPGCVQRVGSRRIAASEAEIADCREQMRVMRSDALDVEWYEGEDGIGLTLPNDAAFNPLVRCRVLARAVVRRGARLFARTPVLQLSGQLVHTAGGAIRSRRVIVAVDGKLEVLLPELVGRVRTARLQMLATAPTAERAVPCPTYYREGFEYWQQLPNGCIALGGFRDKALETEWTLDTAPGGAVQKLLETFLRDHLQVNAPITHRWAASAGYSSNGLPVIEETRDAVWAIGGYSGTGNVIGALCGRAVVAMALRGDYSLRNTLVPI
jgi:gamma-glutamylputrescine oxidase